MIKQVIVIRKDLGMRRGKECSQASHAAMAFLKDRFQHGGYTGRKEGWNHYHLVLNDNEKEWFYNGQAKITLQVSTEEELVDIYNKAREAKLQVFLITDSGHTEFHGVPTKTCLAIGPDESSKIDEITGKLKLY